MIAIHTNRVAASKPFKASRYGHLKRHSVNALSDRLFGSPFLLSDSSLPDLLKKVGDTKGDTADMRTVIMAIGHFLNTFPLPFWLYDLPGLDM